MTSGWLFLTVFVVVLVVVMIGVYFLGKHPPP